MEEKVDVNKINTLNTKLSNNILGKEMDNF